MTCTMGDPSYPDKYILPSHPELRAESLAWTRQEVEAGQTVEIPGTFFAVAAELDGGGRVLSSTLQIIGQGDAFTWRAPTRGRHRIYAFTKYHDFHPGAGKPINFLDRRITQPWLELETAGYERRFAEHFGRTMRGVFFDLEGSFGYKLAWSNDMAADYRQRKGVDIRLRMPLLIEQDTEGLWAKARWDWFDTIGRVYVDCLFSPLDRWCRERGMFMTCHFWEERLFKQAIMTGDFLRAQRSCSMPGTDALFRTIHDPRVLRETQSVCELEGRPCMCEGYGIAGWHFTTAEMKAAANSTIARGVTHLILHGVDSSPKLEKAAYPPDFFHWNPYWRYFHLWSDFLRRGCYVNDHGHLDAGVLVLCPMDSVWALIGDDHFDPAKPQHKNIEDVTDVAMSHADQVYAIDKIYTEVIRGLSNHRIDHLTVDCHYLRNMTLSGGELRYESMAFGAMILPPLKLLPLDVMQRIVEFARGGGKVYALGDLPDSSAEYGAGDPRMAQLVGALRQCTSGVPGNGGIDSLIEAKAPGLEPCVTIEAGAFELIATKRKIGERDFYWLANNEPVRREFVLRFAHAAGEAAIWNCEDGSVRRVRVELSPDAGGCVRLVLEPYEGYWLVFDPDGKVGETAASSTMAQSVKALDGLWTVSVDPADQPVAAQHRQTVPDWLEAGDAVRPLESWLKWGLRGFSGFVDYRMTLNAAQPTGREVLDLGEVKHMAEVWVNGQHAGVRLWPPFRFAVGHLMRGGSNVIDVKVGNLILNAVTQYENYQWKWFDAPTDEQLDCGLFGPVTLQ